MSTCLEHNVVAVRMLKPDINANDVITSLVQGSVRYSNKLYYFYTLDEDDIVDQICVADTQEGLKLCTVEKFYQKGLIIDVIPDIPTKWVVGKFYSSIINVLRNEQQKIRTKSLCNTIKDLIKRLEHTLKLLEERNCHE